MQSLTRSLSVSMVILCKVRSKCECAHTMRVGMYWLLGRTYTTYIYGDKHTSAREVIQTSPPNLTEGGSLRLPIITTNIVAIFQCVLFSPKDLHFRCQELSQPVRTLQDVPSSVTFQDVPSSVTFHSLSTSGLKPSVKTASISTYSHLLMPW